MARGCDPRATATGSTRFSPPLTLESLPVMSTLRPSALLVLALLIAHTAPAATVTAKGGKVTILLEHDDALAISADGEGMIRIDGEGETLINGQEALTEVPLTKLLTLKGAKNANAAVTCQDLATPAAITFQGDGDTLILALVECTVGGPFKVTMKGENAILLASVCDFEDDVQVKSAAADSSISFTVGAVEGKMKISTGAGDDVVTLHTMDIAGQVEIATGSGTDGVDVSHTEAGKLAVAQGDGHLALDLDHFHVYGPVSLAGGKGDALVRIALGTVDGAGKISVGPGPATLLVNQVEFSGKTAITAKSAKGDEQGAVMEIYNNTFGSDLKITGTNLDDGLDFLLNTHLAGKLDLRGLKGDDVFTIGANTLAGASARLDGGPGDDLLNGGQPELTVVNVETLDPD